MEPRSRFERHPRLTLLVVAMMLFVGLDLGMARLLPFSSQPGALVEGRYRIESASYHHDLRPGVSLEGARWGPSIYPVRTNSLGFKDAAPRKVALSSDRRRILFIGDSFTEGIGAAWQDTFVGMVADALGSEAEVLNAGVVSYSPITYWRKVRYLIEERKLAFDELYVFLDISDPQDEMFYTLDSSENVVAAPGSKERGAWLRWVRDARLAARGSVALPLRDRLQVLAQRSLFARALFVLAESAFSPGADEIMDMEWERALRNRRVLWPQDERLRREYADLGNQRAIAYMDRLADLVRRSGIDLAVAVYPRRVQIHHRDRNSLQVAIWKKWAARQGVPLLDFFPCFIGSEPWQEVVDRDFIPGDAHWNASGHRRVANGVLRFDRAGTPPCSG